MKDIPEIELRLALDPETLLGPGKAALLQAIDETGSIAAAGRRTCRESAPSSGICNPTGSCGPSVPKASSTPRTSRGDRHDPQFEGTGMARRHSDQHVYPISSTAAVHPPTIQRHAALGARWRDAAGACRCARGREARGAPRAPTHVVRRLHPGSRPLGHSPFAQGIFAVLVEDPGLGARCPNSTSRGCLHRFDLRRRPKSTRKAPRSLRRKHEESLKRRRHWSGGGRAATTGIARKYSSRPTRNIDDAFEFVEPVGGGRLRGVVLHKLMEEFLTGELDERDPDQVEERARTILHEERHIARPG
jgi:hypothetical protein